VRASIDELLVLTYLGGFAPALLFAVRERPPAPWATDFLVAALVALWPVAALVALGARVYRIMPRRR
jgi:hypothetical protein